MKIRKGQILIDPIYDSDYFNPLTKNIIIPEIAKERCDQGIVRDMGEDCDPSITVGSHVIFSGYSGTNIGVDGRVYILLHNKFVKAVLDNEDTETVNGLWLKGRIDLPDYQRWARTLTMIEPHLVDEKLIQVLNEYDKQKYFPATFDSSIQLLRETATARKVNVKKEEYKEQRDEFDEDNI